MPVESVENKIGNIRLYSPNIQTWDGKEGQVGSSTALKLLMSKMYRELWMYCTCNFCDWGTVVFQCSAGKGGGVGEGQE